MDDTDYRLEQLENRAAYERWWVDTTWNTNRLYCSPLWWLAVAAVSLLALPQVLRGAGNPAWAALYIVCLVFLTLIFGALGSAVFTVLRASYASRWLNLIYPRRKTRLLYRKAQGAGKGNGRRSPGEKGTGAGD